MSTAFLATAAQLSNVLGEFNVDAVSRAMKIGPRPAKRLANRLEAEGIACRVDCLQYKLTDLGAILAQGLLDMLGGR